MANTEIRTCTTHGDTIFVQEGSKNSFRCRKCRVASVDKRRKKIKLKAVEYKGGKCEKCGYDRCVSALEFHHLDPGEKDFGISSGSQLGWDKVSGELDKCIMVCSNCHREIHEELRMGM